MTEVTLLPNGNVKVLIPLAFRSCGGRKRIVAPDVVAPPHDPIIQILARAFRWQELIDDGSFANVRELANAIGKDYGYVARVIRLTLLAPDIVHAALEGTLPDSITLEQLRVALPDDWNEQKKKLNISI